MEKYTMVMKSNRTIAKANLRIFLSNPQHRSGTGTVDLEHVSLFPVDTWMGHENGMRKDLAQALYDMRPGVFRFPGGCIVEGSNLETRYQWKHTVGRWKIDRSTRTVGSRPLPTVTIRTISKAMVWDSMNTSC